MYVLPGMGHGCHMGVYTCHMPLGTLRVPYTMYTSCTGLVHVDGVLGSARLEVCALLQGSGFKGRNVAVFNLTLVINSRTLHAALSPC